MGETSIDIIFGRGLLGWGGREVGKSVRISSLDATTLPRPETFKSWVRWRE